MKCFLDRTDLFKSFNAFRRFKDSRPFHVQGSIFNERQNRSTLPRFGNARNIEMLRRCRRNHRGGAEDAVKRPPVPAGPLYY